MLLHPFLSESHRKELNFSKTFPTTSLLIHSQQSCSPQPRRKEYEASLDKSQILPFKHPAHTEADSGLASHRVTKKQNPLSPLNPPQQAGHKTTKNTCQQKPSERRTETNTLKNLTCDALLRARGRGLWVARGDWSSVALLRETTWLLLSLFSAVAKGASERAAYSARVSNVLVGIWTACFSFVNCALLMSLFSSYYISECELVIIQCSSVGC